MAVSQGTAMSLITDLKYVGLISPRLERFKKKSEYLWNFRCPICGDSKKNKLKARGYFYRRKDGLFFACHNGCDGLSFGNFLKKMDGNLYSQYSLEKYSSGHTENKEQFSSVKKKPEFDTKINLPKISELSNNNPGKRYIVDRKIPTENFSELYYADNFKKFIDELHPNHNKKDLKENPAIIIPLYDDKKKLLGVQGRSLNESGFRYITIKLHDDFIKGYGLDKVDTSKPIYVFEGSLDAIFIKNSVATLDSALHNIIQKFGVHDYIFVVDNQPRNLAVVREVEKLINLDQKVCIWPDFIKQKDVNDMIKDGYSVSEINHIIDNNTFSGPRALLEFHRWKK